MEVMNVKAPSRKGTLTAVASLVFVAAACSATGGDAGAGPSPASGSTSTSGGRGSVPDAGVPDLLIPDAVAAGGAEVVPCTDGEDCVCPTLNVAVVGKPGAWGDGDDSAFQDWLESSSAGTARVANYLDKPEFTADFLAGYDVIILASLGNDSVNGPWWTFSSAELVAFQEWIENQGGGVISLSGYSADAAEINAKNSLLAFSGVAYEEPNISPPCIIENADQNKMCYQCGNPYQIVEWNRSDPVIQNLSLGVTMIGIDGGHPVTAPADAFVAVTTTTDATVNNWLVGKIVGTGRVLVYADEWITYTNQWSGQGSVDPNCEGFLPQDLYQTSQFWYNMIRWVQPNTDCFTIVDSQEPVVLW